MCICTFNVLIWSHEAKKWEAVLFALSSRCKKYHLTYLSFFPYMTAGLILTQAILYNLPTPRCYIIPRVQLLAKLILFWLDVQECSKLAFVEIRNVMLLSSDFFCMVRYFSCSSTSLKDSSWIFFLLKRTTLNFCEQLNTNPATEFMSWRFSHSCQKRNDCSDF